MQSITFILILCSVISPLTALTCFCNTCDINDTCKTNGLCYASSFAKNDSTEHVYACINKKELIPPPYPIICQYSVNNKNSFESKCCDTDLCNKYLKFDREMQLNTSSSHSWWVYTLAIFIPTFATSMCLTYFVCTHQKRHVFNKLRHRKIDYPEGTSSSVGLPILVQRSIARQIQLIEIIGHGRYAEVWRGSWKNDNVAVKVFTTQNERSWTQEVDLYQTTMLRHENVLGFIAADNKDNGTWTQLWLVTDYHEHGSLFDFLNRNRLDEDLMTRMAYSIVNGLSHLHMDIYGMSGAAGCRSLSKPAIAHRDLKTKNILVKSDMTCVIGDLGLAVRRETLETEVADINHMDRVGTIRYMSPEVLGNTIDDACLEPFKMSDIYSLSLIFWEMLNRTCSLNSYRQPYDCFVSSDPSVAEMLHCVVYDKRRPIIEEEWLANQRIKDFVKVIKECWNENPHSRLTVLRVKKNLSTLLDDKNQESISNYKPI